MADTNMQNFDRRMEKLIRKHQRLARGYVPAITDDGLIVARPRRSIRLPWRPFLWLAVAAFVVKVAAVSILGPEAYNAKVADLTAGTEMQRVGAWVMNADPITVALSEQFAVLFN